MTMSNQQTAGTTVPLDLTTKPRDGKASEEDGRCQPQSDRASCHNGHVTDNGAAKVKTESFHPGVDPEWSNGVENHSAIKRLDDHCRAVPVKTVKEEAGRTPNDHPVTPHPRPRSPRRASPLSPPKCAAERNAADGDPKPMDKSASNLPFRKRHFPERDTLGPRRSSPAGEIPQSPAHDEEFRCSPGLPKIPKRNAPKDSGYLPPAALLPFTTNGQDDRRPATEPYAPLPAYAPYFRVPLPGYTLCPVPQVLINVPVTPLPLPLPPMEEMDRLSRDAAMATRQDDDGDTALHIAVVQGQDAVVHRLIHTLVQANKDLDIYNNLRQTPLHLAVITNQAPLVQALLQAGSDPGALDRNGQTAAHLCCEHGLGACLQLVLSHHSPSACLEVRNYEGLTPLHLAVQNGNKELVRLLLDSGANIDAVDIKSGRSPLIHAVENNNMEMINFLIENGCNVNAQSYSGNTALHSACGRGQVEAVRILLRNGADSSLKNYHNDTALMVAKNKKVTDVLRGKGSRSQNPKPVEPLSDPPSPQRHTPQSRQHSANGTPVQSPSHTLHRSPLATPTNLALPLQHSPSHSPRAPPTRSPLSQSADSQSGSNLSHQASHGPPVHHGQSRPSSHSSDQSDASTMSISSGGKGDS
ncbi:hypothetical protein MATL_G00126830 [Megalops atlanticus]|uniref:B-cell lymphoma 3 protein n=1 Tax=Megalops atlanticus TaxID=7932 RepID=A0A9D3PZE3_MEGAT|nr:hypothetical protein MATL_G00126830 [Megalops atlanticus]